MNNCLCPCHVTGIKFKKTAESEPFFINQSNEKTYKAIDCCQCNDYKKLLCFIKKIISIKNPTKRTAILIIEDAKNILEEIHE